MQTVIVMCGFPRCGKTTYAKTYLKDYVRVSMDDLVEMMTGSFNIKSGNLYKKVEGIIIKELISKKLDIVIDRTSLTKKSRRRTLSRINLSVKDAGIPKPVLKLIILETPIDICIQRNIETQKVPKGIFLQMLRSYEEPTLDEGWDEIIIIKDF